MHIVGREVRQSFPFLSTLCKLLGYQEKTEERDWLFGGGVGVKGRNWNKHCLSGWEMLD